MTFLTIPLRHWRLCMTKRFVLVLVTIGVLYYAVMHETESGLLEDVLLANRKPTPGRTIFFIETSRPLTSQPGLRRNLTILELTARPACAIESAALHSPNSDVFVLFTTDTYRSKISTNRQMEALLAYPNVHLRTVNLWTFAPDTPTYNWLKTGQLFTSLYPTIHTSDFLRLLALWRWGGTYLDTDVVVLRTIEKLAPNYIGTESSKSLNNAVFNLAHDGLGHLVATQCLVHFQRDFEPKIWEGNGPVLITRVIGSLCGTEKIKLMLNSNWSCMGFRIFDKKAFYAIDPGNWFLLFEPLYVEQALSLINDSYVVHAWNSLSRDDPIKVGSDAAYEKLAEKHCPRVYSATGEYF